MGNAGSKEDDMGIGVDIELVGRFKDAKDRRLLERMFTKGELGYCLAKANPERHLAARYAAKEAVYKALSCLDGKMVEGLSFRNIEVVNDENGTPRVRFQNRALQGIRVQISLSHCDDTAVAFAIVKNSKHRDGAIRR